MNFSLSAEGATQARPASAGSRDRVVTALVFAVTLAFQLPFYDRWLAGMDEGHMALYAEIAATGGVDPPRPATQSIRQRRFARSSFRSVSALRREILSRCGVASPPRQTGRSSSRLTSAAGRMETCQRVRGTECVDIGRGGVIPPPRAWHGVQNIVSTPSCPSGRTSAPQNGARTFSKKNGPSVRADLNDLHPVGLVRDQLLPSTFTSSYDENIRWERSPE